MSFARLLERSRERLRQTRGAVGTRLTAGYVLLLLVSMALLYGLAAWQMERALQARDRGVIAAEMEELAREYAEQGRAALEEEASEELTGPTGRPLYIRLTDPTGRTLFGRTGGAWPPAALRRLGEEAAPPVATSSTITWTQVPTGEDGEALEVAARCLPDGSVLQVGASVEPRAEVMVQFRDTFLMATVPVLVLGLLGGLLLARRVLRPLRELARVAGRIAATGDVAARVPVRGLAGKRGDELDDLARLFNDMLGRVERLVERMRETLDHVAHDLRTPMTRLRGRAELTLHAAAVTKDSEDVGEAESSDREAESYREALADTLESAAQVLAVLDAIMDEAEARAGTLPLHLERVSLSALADEVVDLYGYVAEEKGITLEAQGEATVRADQSRMRQAVANLVDNAVKYTPPGGAVRIKVNAVSAETASAEDVGAVIRVWDTGPGISDEDRPHIWDRLYRGDRSRSTHGLGLGLSLVQSIVEAHGGTADVENASGEGSVFTIRVPGSPGPSKRN